MKLTKREFIIIGISSVMGAMFLPLVSRLSPRDTAISGFDPACEYIMRARVERMNDIEAINTWIFQAKGIVPNEHWGKIILKADAYNDPLRGPGQTIFWHFHPVHRGGYLGLDGKWEYQVSEGLYTWVVVGHYDKHEQFWNLKKVGMYK